MKKASNVLIWTVALFIGIWIGASLLSFTHLPANLESQVRQWSEPYPADLRNRWAWCYLDSAENWSTDTKLREDVRLKSVQVLTAEERHVLTPLDDQIKEAIPKQKTPLKETYHAVGSGLQVAEWHPPPEEPKPPPPKPEPPQRQRLIRR
jgi:hypothetical protein